MQKQEQQGIISRFIEHLSFNNSMNKEQGFDLKKYINNEK